MANLTNEKAEFAIAIFRHFSPFFAIFRHWPPPHLKFGVHCPKAISYDL